VHGRPVDALLANAGRGLGHAFLDQDFAQAREKNRRSIERLRKFTIYLTLVHVFGWQKLTRRSLTLRKKTFGKSELK
jgi:hypothetical protein